ncbi:hypothetical protein Droror1_Dr00027019 [Drosera rotundifolia]
MNPGEGEEDSLFCAPFIQKYGDQDRARCEMNSFSFSLVHLSFFFNGNDEKWTNDYKNGNYSFLAQRGNMPKLEESNATCIFHCFCFPPFIFGVWTSSSSLTFSTMMVSWSYSRGKTIISCLSLS